MTEEEKLIRTAKERQQRKIQPQKTGEHCHKIGRNPVPKNQLL